ncbi:keratin, type II cytoskeletal 8-like isoform X1 [Lutra lutra]|uniref:keratin, type II cytoskeletal 8-like isoform X1 n=1 Tax=Lutra lutra TaxID=9657 RepID=UPI001FD60C76|nr:keratin, type II cytoskeletal 8-like isoform X1 [Lutra lutra]
MCEEVQATVQKPTQSLRHSKEELNRLNQAIQRLTAEVDSAKSQPCELDRGTEPRALPEEGASDSAQGKLAWLEAALQRAKHDMVRQLREYQDLMIVKLGLDFEIATYRKLLEGEESSPGQRFHLRTWLSLGPRPPAASRSGFRRPADGRPWRRLRALRLPRLPRRFRLPRHPRMLNISAQLWRSQRPLAPAPKDLTLCLRRPLLRNWTSLHLSIMVTPHPPTSPQSGKSWNLAYGMVTALPLGEDSRDPVPLGRLGGLPGPSTLLL